MKKTLALFLTLAMLLSLCACGSGDSGSVVASDGGTKADSTKGGDIGYLTYEDLTQTHNSWVRLDEGDIQIQIDHPTGFAFEGQAGHDVASTNNYCFTILMTHSTVPMPGVSLEEAFYTLLNGEDGLHSTLRMRNRAEYSEVSPETESVTLECGKKAIMFSGIQHMDEYGTPSDCPIFGYGTLVDDIPVIVCYVIFDVKDFEEGIASERKGFITTDEMAHYVEEMINTLRIVEE